MDSTCIGEVISWLSSTPTQEWISFCIQSIVTGRFETDETAEQRTIISYIYAALHTSSPKQKAGTSPVGSVDCSTRPRLPRPPTRSSTSPASLKGGYHLINEENLDRTRLEEIRTGPRAVSPVAVSRACTRT